MPEQPPVNAGDRPDDPGLDELGTLVIRAWREPLAEHGLRVRLLASHGGSEPTSTVHSDPEGVLAAVRSWLEAQA